MKFTTLIPLRFNDGREVSLEQISRFVDELAARFNGCSDEGITKGQWLDPKDSRLYRDEAAESPSSATTLSCARRNGR